jgi:hypothetical protein
MILYHRTNRREGDSILRSGFHDHGPYDTLYGWRSGVWFDDFPRPPHSSHSVEGSALLVVDIPEAEIKEFELLHADTRRDWLIPMTVVNRWPVWEQAADVEDGINQG